MRTAFFRRIRFPTLGSGCQGDNTIKLERQPGGFPADQPSWPASSRTRRRRRCAASAYSLGGRAPPPSRPARRARAACPARGPAASTSCAPPPSRRPQSGGRCPTRNVTPSLFAIASASRIIAMHSSRVSGILHQIHERRASQRADRIERQVPPQLEPDLAANVVRDRRLESRLVRLGEIA